MTLAKVVRSLKRHYGAAPKPVSRDPFQLILFEQVAYLATEAVRRVAFRRLRTEVGVTPAEILAAPHSTLVAVARSGGAIAASLRASRMRTTAEMTVADWDGELRGALKLPVAQARAALAAFPMIGKPGADRILAVTGAHAVFGIDSNALRVLIRLGWGNEIANYAAAYRSVQDAIAAELPKKPAQLAEVAELLRRHGQELCRRSAPRCPECPLVRDCAFSRGVKK